MAYECWPNASYDDDHIRDSIDESPKWFSFCRLRWHCLLEQKQNDFNFDNGLHSEFLRHLHCGANTFIGLLNTCIQTDVDAIVDVLILAQRWLANSSRNFFTWIRRRIPVAQLFFAFGAHIWSEKRKKNKLVDFASIERFEFRCENKVRFETTAHSTERQNGRPAPNYPFEQISAI